MSDQTHKGTVITDLWDLTEKFFQADVQRRRAMEAAREIQSSQSDTRSFHDEQD